MRSPNSLLLLAVVITAVYAAGTGAVRATDKYKGYQAFLIRPETSTQWDAISTLRNMPGVDFWSYPKIDSPGVAMVPPELLTKVHRWLINRHIPYNVTIANVAQSLRQNNRRLEESLSNRRIMTGSSPFNSYMRYKEMLYYINDLKRQHPGLIRTKKVGITYEGRTIHVIRLSTDFSARKPVVFMEAGMHAREWVGPAMAIYMITKAVKNQTLLADNDWHIIPVSNPDGYEYTHTNDRLWRKNRVKLNAGCYGVDGNRNFDIDFGRVGGSTDHCSPIYVGPYPFSEAESRAVQLGVKLVATRIRTFISLHSYGPFILYPFGFTTDKDAPTTDAMGQCAEEAKAQMDALQPNNYTYGNTAKLLYESSGGSDDWASAVMQVPYAYTVELPGGGPHGFDLPPEQLKSTLRLSFPGVLQLANCERLKH